MPPKYQLPRDPVFLPPRQQNDNPGILLICQIRFRRYLRSGAQLQEERAGGKTPVNCHTGNNLTRLPVPVRHPPQHALKRRHLSGFVVAT